MLREPGLDLVGERRLTLGGRGHPLGVDDQVDHPGFACLVVGIAGLDPGGGCLGERDRPLAAPLRRLEPAPGGEDGGDREHRHRDDLDERAVTPTRHGRRRRGRRRGSGRARRLITHGCPFVARPTRVAAHNGTARDIPATRSAGPARPRSEGAASGALCLGAGSTRCLCPRLTAAQSVGVRGSRALADDESRAFRGERRSLVSSISWSSSWNPRRPSPAKSWSAVVSGGDHSSASGWSSNPTTRDVVGHRQPGVGEPADDAHRDLVVAAEAPP